MKRNEIRTVGFKFMSPNELTALKDLCAEAGEYPCIDDVFDTVAIIFDGESPYNIIPNTDKALDIIRKENDFILFGLWILIYDMSAETWDLLEADNLASHYGYNEDYTEFIQKSDML